ncbi:MAG: Acyl-CoA synthetase (AMP-forming)/AMP-acid ligase [Actinomycetia bacterium]|nr:Acyl-CoA synthetase (AMP-forming)/AMP-acid ligase [Actinomycetes bacterium]
MPAADAAALLRRNASDPSIADRPAVRFGDRIWTHGEYVAECMRWANLFLDRKPADDALHVAVLLDNTPDYLFALGGAALSGSAIVGLNHTRRGEHLLRDLTHTHCGLVITEPRHQHLLEAAAADLPEVLVTARDAERGDPPVVLGKDLDEALAGFDASDAGIEPGPDTLMCLIFTSGTSDAPKAVIASQRRFLVTGTRMGIIMELGPDDTGYICMPLFHSNALMVGWAPSIVLGASVGLARRFSASRWLADVRRYGSTYFNYTGKPLAYLLSTPEKPDDADNPMRVAFGNEGSPEIVDGFARRYGVDVIDAYGATEGGVAVNRAAEARPGALGTAPDNVKVVDEDGNPMAVAEFDAQGRLTNAEAAVGEMVNTDGAGPFEGYYNNDEANAKTLRFGWYWTGDLAYIDADRYIYFAGRNADWIRVDGENFPAAPIEKTVSQHPDVVQAAVYGVPDDQAGDQVMAGLVLREGAELDPAAFAQWIDDQTDIGPKWRPRYVRVMRNPPTTGTNKIVKRTLVHQKWRRDLVDGDPVFVRGRDDPEYRSFDEAEEQALHASFVKYQRERFWDL